MNQQTASFLIIFAFCVFFLAIPIAVRFMKDKNFLKQNSNSAEEENKNEEIVLSKDELEKINQSLPETEAFFLNEDNAGGGWDPG